MFVYSLLIATFLGTMGLPHILVRFYTNPDGPAARHTTVRVIGLLGLFYLFPGIYGALGRVLVPQLYVTGATDTVVLRLPQAALAGNDGQLLGAITAAGAFAAFLSTSSGLLVLDRGDDFPRRLAAVLPRAHDHGGDPPPALPPGRGARDARPYRGGLLRAGDRYRRARGLGLRARGEHVLPALPARDLVDPSDRYRRRLGHGDGAVIATGGILAGLALGEPSGVAGALLAQPAIVSVPIAFLVMIVVSLRAAERPTPDAEMLALHAPEGLDLPEMGVRDPFVLGPRAGV